MMPAVTVEISGVPGIIVAACLAFLTGIFMWMLKGVQQMVSNLIAINARLSIMDLKFGGKEDEHSVLGRLSVMEKKVEQLDRRKE